MFGANAFALPDGTIVFIDKLVDPQVLDGDPSDAEAGPLVKQVVAQHGDVRQLLASCEAIAAYNGDNYYPLMWRFYRSHRSTLFRLAHTLRQHHAGHLGHGSARGGSGERGSDR